MSFRTADFLRVSAVALSLLMTPAFSFAEEEAKPAEAAPAAAAEETKPAPKEESKEETKKNDAAEAKAAAAATKDEFATVEAIEDEGSLTINGKEAKVGDKIALDDVVANEDKTATITLKQGGTIQLDEESEITGKKSDSAPRFVVLNKGRVKGALESKGKESAPASKKHRLMIRTRTAVLGVRGTEFVVLEGAESAQFHTLTGVVDVAKDEAALAAGEGVPVTSGNFVEATAAGITAPAPTPAGALGALGAPPVPVPPVPPAGAAAGAALGAAGAILGAFELLNFEVGAHAIRFRSSAGEGVYNVDTSNAYQQIGGEAAWTPLFRVLPGFLYLKGHAGAFVLGSEEKGHDGFLSPVFGASIRLKLLGQLSVEAGARVQWWEMSDMVPALVAQVNLPLPLPLINRFYVGVGQIFTPESLKPVGFENKSYVHIDVRAGLGITLPGL